MQRSDWIGMGTSLAVHLALLLLFTFVNLGTAEPTPIGYIEVEFGPLAEGRPVQRGEPAVEPEPEVEQPPETPSEPATTPPEEAEPVDLPQQEQPSEDPETLPDPDTEAIAPETTPDPADRESDEAAPDADAAPVRGGAADGTDGSDEGDDGEGTEAEAASPFQIEGLNRIPVDAPLPRYAEKVNAVISVRITVDPQGRIVRRLPLIKGNPALEQSVMQALAQWRFNALPPGAPQEAQTGTITFRFQLE